MRETSFDKNLAIPLYHQLYVALRDAILSGVYPPGTALPSERTLMARHKVSRMTVQRAISQLQSESYVSREHGRGSFVCATLPTRPNSASMKALLDNVMAIGEATEGRLLELADVIPEPRIRNALQLPERAKVQRSVHLRLRDDEPLGVITTCVREDIGRFISAHDIETKPMLVLLEQRGLHPAWASQVIGAMAATATVATHLGIPEGEPLVRVRRVVHDLKDVPIEYLDALYRADRYEHRTVLRQEVSWH
ncbi:MAG: GntR family transcriptional regulator [Pigmentiphaga sp.]